LVCICWFKHLFYQWF